MQTPVTVGGAADAFYGWTIIQLVLMAGAAVLVVVGMIYGRRLAHRRHRAQQAAEERAEEAGIEPPSEEIAEAEVPAAGEPDPEANRASGTPRDPGYELAPAEPAAEPEPADPMAAPKPRPTAAATPEPPATAEPEPADAPAAPIEPTIAGALALTTIKGLGPKVAAMLAERGITRVDQLAALSAKEATELDVQLGAFTGRMARDRWVDQAKLLASGDTAAYEAEFGKLG